MVYKRIGAVTGANKGIGFAIGRYVPPLWNLSIHVNNLSYIVRQLALQYPKSPFNDGLLLIYLTARDRSRGEEALKILQSDPELKKAKVLVSDGGLTDIKFHELDISKTKSIQEFSSFLMKQHPDGIDFGSQNKNGKHSDYGG